MQPDDGKKIMLIELRSFNTRNRKNTKGDSPQKRNAAERSTEITPKLFDRANAEVRNQMLVLRLRQGFGGRVVLVVVLPMNTCSTPFRGRDGLRAVPFFLRVMGPDD